MDISLQGDLALDGGAHALPAGTGIAGGRAKSGAGELSATDRLRGGTRQTIRRYG